MGASWLKRIDISRRMISCDAGASGPDSEPGAR